MAKLAMVVIMVVIMVVVVMVVMVIVMVLVMIKMVKRVIRLMIVIMVTRARREQVKQGGWVGEDRGQAVRDRRVHDGGVAAEEEVWDWEVFVLQLMSSSSEHTLRVKSPGLWRWWERRHEQARCLTRGFARGGATWTGARGTHRVAGGQGGQGGASKDRGGTDGSE